MAEPLPAVAGARRRERSIRELLKQVVMLQARYS